MSRKRAVGSHDVHLSLSSLTSGPPTLTIGSTAIVIPAQSLTPRPGPEIRNIRRFMQLLADSVTDISSDHREAEALDIRLHRKTNVTDAVSGFRLGDSSPEALLCDLDKLISLIAHLPTGKVFALSP